MAQSAASLALPYRRRQAQLSARLVRQLAGAWRDLVDRGRVDASWPALRSVLAPLILQARAESADLARAAFLEAREAAGAPGRFTPEPPPALDRDRLERTLDVTGPVEFKRAIARGRTEQQAVDAAAVRIAASGQYLAQEGGRQLLKQAIADDVTVTGWARVTDGDPCAWCAMLASRGPVYKSAQTAGRAQNEQFTGPGQFKYHDMCGCVAWPSFTYDEPFVGIAEDLYDAWREQTRGHGGRDAVNAWRRWWESEGRAAYTSPRETEPTP
ncbi:hypothetical protein ACFXHD_02915 [Streptomyces hydrogenans]|uniref:VG15 protein n=1 Tax=Streptomyces hydrogenans TaxID=1873719 RepID=UPI0036A82B21